MQTTIKPSQVVVRVFATLFLVACVGFIFYNSSRIGTVSGQISQGVTATFNRILSGLGSGFRISEHTVRKLGHVAEFALLGFVFMVTLRVYSKRVLAFIAWPLFGGLAIAVCDEFLQSFVPGRSSEVRDVLIDFAGLTLGILAGLVVLAFFTWLFTRRRKKVE